MIVKKKAILEELKFTRVFWKYSPTSGSNVCSDCNCLFKDLDVYARHCIPERPDPCEVCELVHCKTRTGDLDISYAYIVKK